MVEPILGDPVPSNRRPRSRWARVLVISEPLLIVPNETAEDGHTHFERKSEGNVVQDAEAWRHECDLALGECGARPAIGILGLCELRVFDAAGGVSGQIANIGTDDLHCSLNERAYINLRREQPMFWRNKRTAGTR